MFVDGDMTMRIGLGLDTGGTFTDAVIMDLESNKILCKAKSPTTREDLCIGIREAIGRMNPDYMHEIGVVSLSSTLATNSIVEGKGARVALVCMGESYDNSYPADFTIETEGAHDLRGLESAPLNEEPVRAFLEDLRGRIDAVAIAGYLSVRNPEHEERIRALADRILGLPAVCGHDLTSGLGFNERAATCVMNARLIPVIDELIRSVKSVLQEYGIAAPLMMVRGDGSMMGETEARLKPVETIMSGPAASMIGAMSLTGMEDAIVMDMGGTTTDIGILRGGKPRLEPEGATIGGIRTRVMAAEISTSGIGGDSRIVAIGGRVVLNSLRVIPICYAARRWPSVAEMVAELSEDKPRLNVIHDPEELVLDSEYFRTLRIPDDKRDFSEADVQLLNVLVEGPMNLREAGTRLGRHPFSFNVRRLESLGLVQRIGFTPTDVLHASGEFEEYDLVASTIVAEYLARGIGMDAAAFLKECRTAIRQKLCTELIKELLMEETGSMNLGTAGEDLLKKAVDGGHDGEYSCRIGIGKPIIGIGAPVQAYIPQVGQVFDTEVLIHPDSDVGNAVGAITSSVSETLTVLIRPEALGSEDSFTEFSKLGRFEFDSLDVALDHAETIASEAVREAVIRSGAEDIRVTCNRRDREFTYGDTGQTCLMEVVLTVMAAGRPCQFHPSE